MLVAGASSEIGRELAPCFAADGRRLVLTARRQAELNALAAELRPQSGSDVTVVTSDLATLVGVQQLLTTLRRRELSPDVLVNNAGFGARGEFSEMSLDRITSMLTVNVEALTMLARESLPAMRNRKRGGVLNVASTAAFQPGPFMAGSLLFRLGSMDTAIVARAAHAGIRRGRAIVVPGLRNKFGRQSPRVSPRAMVRNLVARLRL